MGSLNQLVLKDVEINRLSIATDLLNLILPDFKNENTSIVHLYCNDDFIHCVDIYIDGVHACMAFISKEKTIPDVGKRLVTTVKNFNEVDTITRSNCVLESYSKNSFRGYITKDEMKNFDIKFIQGDKVAKEIIRTAHQSDNIVCLSGFSIATAVCGTSASSILLFLGGKYFFDSKWGEIKKRQQGEILDIMRKFYISVDYEILEIKNLNELIHYEKETMEELLLLEKKFEEDKKKFEKELQDEKTKLESKILYEKTKLESKILYEKTKLENELKEEKTKLENELKEEKTKLENELKEENRNVEKDKRKEIKKKFDEEIQEIKDNYRKEKKKLKENNGCEYMEKEFDRILKECRENEELYDSILRSMNEKDEKEWCDKNNNSYNEDDKHYY